MGITIHFSGKLRSMHDQPKVFRIVQAYAQENGWEVRAVEDPEGALYFMRNGVVEPYEGPVSGWVVEAHPACEPLFLLFDLEGHVQQSLKTQHAPREVHVQFVRLLASMAQLFSAWEVRDEGGYWETRDERLLQDRLDRLAQLNSALPALAGPLPHPPSGPELN
ncbi:MAG: hypothetical protein R2817_13935 [Flavobacteriales bacterium]